MASRRGLAMGKTLVVGLLVITLATTTLSGCAGLQQSMGQSPGRAAAICAGGGALAGAAAGALLDRGSPLRGAIIGGLAGALTAGATCFAIAKANSTSVKDYQQTQAAVGYQPTQGTLVRVEDLTVQPVNVSPGEKFTWRSQYVVMTPDPNTDVPVVETRILSAYDEKAKQWKEMGRHRTEITAKPGTRVDEAEMAMPSKPTARRYMVAFEVEHNKVSDQKSQEMSVVTRPASLPTEMGWTVVELKSGGGVVARDR